MKKLPFRIPGTSFMGSSDAAYLSGDEDLTEALVAQVLDDIDLDVEVIIGDVQAPLAFWRDPDHWSTDWAEKLGCEWDEVADRVAEILTGAVTE